MKFIIILVLLLCLIAVVVGSTKCEKHRKKELKKSEKGIVGNFIPVCDKKGNYKQVQCHGSTGFCWCVNKKGHKTTKPVRGKPKCPKS